MKTCSTCGIEKGYSNFYAQPRMSDGFSSKCKDCMNKRQKENYKLSRVKNLSADDISNIKIVNKLRKEGLTLNDIKYITGLSYNTVKSYCTNLRNLG